MHLSRLLFEDEKDRAFIRIYGLLVNFLVSIANRHQDNDKKDRAFIRIHGSLVNILVTIAPDVYGPYVTVGKIGERQLLVQCLTALYGTMVALLLYYKKFAKSLKSKGFKLNPYDPCMVNTQVKGGQLTVCFHVDDCKILHLIPKVVDKTIEWLQFEYENEFEDGTGQMKVHCGKTHKYLGMTLNFGHDNQCRISMIDYVDVIVAAYDKALGKLDDGFSAVKKKKNPARTSAGPADLFVVDKDAES
jgi:hypothetical protein